MRKTIFLSKGNNKRITHFLGSAHPKWSPMKMVQSLKQETSKKLRIMYASIRNTRNTDDFWATGYYCGTAGHVARYITEQTIVLKRKKVTQVNPDDY